MSGCSCKSCFIITCCQLSLLSQLDVAASRTTGNFYFLQKYLQMQGRKSLRQVGSPTPPSVPEKQSLQVAKDQHRVTSRRDRALKRRASLDAIKDRQPLKRRRTQPTLAQESGPSRKSRSVGGATSRVRRKGVDARGDSSKVAGGEEEEEIVLKRPNGGGDYLGGEEENGEVTPTEESVTSEESEVTLRKPEGGDMVMQEDDDDDEVTLGKPEGGDMVMQEDDDDDEVTLGKPDKGGDSDDVDIKWDNGIEGESVEVGVSSSEGKIGDGGEETFTDDIGVEVATEEVECTVNYDLSGGNEVIEMTTLAEDTATGESTVDTDNCDEQQTVGDLPVDECSEQQVERVSADNVEVERSSANDVMRDIIASTIVRRTASVDTDITEASVESSGAGGSSCGTEEKDSDKEEVAPSDDEKPLPKVLIP